MGANLNESFIDWICYDCGCRFGKHEPTVATWHPGLCDVCHMLKSVTELRDFGGLQKDKD